MQLEPLCDVSWRYSLMRSVDPSTRGDGRVYGQGDGTFTGRLAGEAQWSNSPRLRGAYAYPNANGAIEVAGGGLVLFTLTGMSSLEDARGVHVMQFETADPGHLWLNELIAVGEGSIDPGRGVLSMRYYECIVDFLPDIGASR